MALLLALSGKQVSKLSKLSHLHINKYFRIMKKCVNIIVDVVGGLACFVLVVCCIINIFWQMYGYLQKATTIYELLFD